MILELIKCFFTGLVVLLVIFFIIVILMFLTHVIHTYPGISNILAVLFFIIVSITIGRIIRW